MFSFSNELITIFLFLVVLYKLSWAWLYLMLIGFFMFFLSYFVLFYLTVLYIKNLVSPLHLGFFLMALTMLIGVFVVDTISCVYGLTLIFVMAGGVVVSFLFTVAVIENHLFYFSILFNSNYRNILLFFYSIVIFFMIIDKMEDFYFLILYMPMILLGLGLIILFCLLGTVKSCSFSFGPLRKNN